MNEHIGGSIRKISNKIRRKVDSCSTIKAIEQCSGVNAFFLGFIDKNNGIYQKDLENEFGITRSTASKIVSLMEKKNMIERLSDESDKRIKKIVLTDEAKLMSSKIKDEIAEVERNVTKGFSKEELALLTSFLDRIEKNIEN